MQIGEHVGEAHQTKSHLFTVAKSHGVVDRSGRCFDELSVFDGGDFGVKFSNRSLRVEEFGEELPGFFFRSVHKA